MLWKRGKRQNEKRAKEDIVGLDEVMLIPVE